MARKRREGVTTMPRYLIKMIRVMGGTPPASWTEMYALSLYGARMAGYGLYKMIWDEVKAKLRELRVPSALHGLYKAFTNQFINRVQRKKIETREECIDKWTKQGLDPGVLNQLADVIHAVYVEAETPKAPAKGA